MDKKKKSQLPAYGGQAVIEGVMFGGKNVNVTAIRRTDMRIDFFEVTRQEPAQWLRACKKVPFLRGIVTILESAASGTRHLNFSSERFDVDPVKDEHIVPTEKSSKLTMIFGAAAIGIFSFLFGKIIFTAVPAVLASFFDQWVENNVLRNLIEGGIKAVLLCSYIWAIGQTPLIKRLFQYHGAEHKVINTFENGEELTVQNVKKHSRLHYRCGSSFIIFTVITGVVVYSFFTYESVWERVFERILLIPVVLGISYEVLRFTNLLRDIPVLRYLGHPGLWLQRLTTREPDESQIEVSIAAFLRMRELEQRTGRGEYIRTPDAKAETLSI